MNNISEARVYAVGHLWLFYTSSGLNSCRFSIGGVVMQDKEVLLIRYKLILCNNKLER